jgi:putative tricarboxylic transport membrane protein
MSKEYKGLFFAGVLSVVSILYLIGAWNIRLGSLSSSEGRLIPQVAGLLLLVLSFIQIVSNLRLILRNKEPAQIPESLKSMKKDPGTRRVFITLSLIAGYVIFLPYLGFILATFFYLFLQMLTLSGRTQKIPLFLIVSLFCTFFVHYVFVTWFELLLPAGLLFG